MELIMIESRMVPSAEQQHAQQADGNLQQPQAGSPVPMHATSCTTFTVEQ